MQREPKKVIWEKVKKNITEKRKHRRLTINPRVNFKLKKRNLTLNNEKNAW